MANVTTLVNFNGTDGATPEGRLIVDANGDLIGTTEGGGASKYGTVFEIGMTSDGYADTPNILVSFSFPDGIEPRVGLIADTEGDLFGITPYGGKSGDDGTVFELTKSAGGYASVPTVLVSFSGSSSSFSTGDLLIDSSGDLFGTTAPAANGIVFEIAKSAGGYASTPITLVNFSGANGDLPSGLIADATGDLFGTSLIDGAHNDGTAFEIVKTSSGYVSTPSTLVNFAGSDGAYPAAGLIMDANGDLFGTTSAGGANNDGTVFEIAKTADGYTGAPATLLSFNGTDGASPQAGLIMDANGDLFGTTFAGGPDSDGTVFEIAKTADGYAGAPTTLLSFNGTDGAAPLAGLIANAEGDLFGTSEKGGASNDGTVFELTGTGYVACFCSGTHIQTSRGEIAVEALTIGDAVVTADGAAQPVCWIGRRHISLATVAMRAAAQAVRVSAQAFGPGLPRRDLFLSPDHAVFAAGVLIPVKHLVNGATIVPATRDEVTYWHVELQRHAVILAEGLPCESYLDLGSRHGFAIRGGFAALDPGYQPDACCEAVWEAAACAPLRITGAAVGRVKAQLRRQAGRLGHAPAAVNAGRACAANYARPVTSDLAALLQPDWYCTTYPDVAAAGVAPKTHYAAWAGRWEGRLPCPDTDLVRGLSLIDPVSVAIIMPDVVAAGLDPVEHFCAIGWQERRRPNPYFDTGWYLEQHPVSPNVNPLVHYIRWGENRGFAPSPHFDPVWYRQRYGIGHTHSALAHYLQHRQTQCFSPRPGFDVEAYVRAYAATLLPNRDPYAHYLAMGRFAAAGGGKVARVAA